MWRGWMREIPENSSMQGTQRAYLSRIALAVRAGNPEEGVAMLERELAFRRVMLAGSHTLISKMIANALYVRSLALLADLLQHHAANSSRIGRALRC